MMRHGINAALLGLLALATLSSTAYADAMRGKTLHDQQCIACHASRFSNNGAEIYTRSDRRVTSLDGLHKQVNRCKDNLSITWFDDDVSDVVDYLNATYYKFNK